MRITNPHRYARDARTQAAVARAEADELRSLPITEAAPLIQAKRAEQEHARQRAAERSRQLHDPFEHDPHQRAAPRGASTRAVAPRLPRAGLRE